ncbi:uncharacterized protein LOC111396246 isoform X3 [Olea europaea var. sylvestris]|uniref:uncharacterized protein LOC111396246 isoform X3 n=1 Tax=Olea europaea var. sylvestris TaxID=158386 RepID=UPI000C1D5F39|nr:uncharacterized protein LOC111396246 isoform X3 [Olea europaea var. sylvestris]
MNLLKIKLNHHRFNHRHQLCQNSQITPNLSPHFLFHPSQKQKSNFSVSYTPLIYSFTKYAKASAIHSKTPFFANEKLEEEEESKDFEEYLAEDGEVYQKTLRLVECAMFSAVSGLAFLLSNSLAIEKYFACFFALPIVLSSMRWGIAAGRKTMVATAVLLFVLSGPVKAITYLLLHGLLGFAMGTSWRSQASWSTSVFLCSFVRAVGAIGLPSTSMLYSHICSHPSALMQFHQ